MKDDHDRAAGAKVPTSAGSRKRTSRKSATKQPKSKKAGSAGTRPVQLTIFDYAASLGVSLLAEAS